MRSKGLRKNWVAAVILIAILVGVLSVTLKKNGQKKPQAKTAAVVKGDLDIWISATGKVRPRVEVEVKSKAGGEIKEILVEEGDFVEKGTLLVRIDPTTQESELKKARSLRSASGAALARARSQRELAEKQLERGDELAQEGFISTDTLDQLKTQLRLSRDSERAAAADLSLASENYRLAKEALDDTEVVAPMSGTILKKYVEEGQIISSGLNAVTGGTALILMAELNDPEVVAQVDESDVGGIEVGSKARVTLDSFPGETFAGKVERIAPMGTMASNVTGFEVVVRLDEHPKRESLRPQMTAQVEILTRSLKNATLVPAAAIRSFRGQPGVWVPGAGEEEPTFKQIKIGATDGFTVEVISGVSPGEKVITGKTPGEEGFQGGPGRMFGCGRR